MSQRDSLWEALGTHRDQEEQEDASKTGVILQADNKPSKKDPPQPFRHSWTDLGEQTHTDMALRRTATPFPIHAVVSYWGGCNDTVLGDPGDSSGLHQDLGL